MKKSHIYTTDKKVMMYSTESNVNNKLASILGQEFVEYRQKWDAVNRFELETNFPLYLQIELNQICNLRCPTCSITVPEAKMKYVTQEKMDWKLYEKIILEGEKYNCPSLNPQGVNEPLLIDNMEDYIKFASRHGFIDIMMNTNATLLSEERSQKLLDSGITRLRFSLDAATKETYEKTRVGGNYEKVMENIERFITMRNNGEYELPLVGVNFCKTSLNEHEEELFIEKWHETADFISIQEFIPPETENDYSDFFPKNSEFRNDMLINGFKCDQPWNRLYVHSNGQVCPCCAFFNSELEVGNISEDSLYNFWNSESMKNMRALQKNGEFWKNSWCKKCVMSISNMKETELIQIKKSHSP
tara:strand:+ start:4310 stop:5386 length:1077 start_codon:yes stop_codon:yes gene_type:complete